MTVTFENDNEVIFYALEMIISFARNSQQIFVAQCVWWLASIIGLEDALVNHIDTLHGQTTVRKEHTAKEVSDPVIQNTPEIQGTKVLEPKEDHRDKILKECEEYLRDSRRLRRIATLKSKGKTSTGRINPTPISKKTLSRKDKRQRKPVENLNKLEGISETEIQRRKGEAECLRCAWPSDRKGAHRVVDCRRPIKLEIGTACYPKAREPPRPRRGYQQPTIAEVDCDITSSEESSDDSL
jgi:hypothetical protein